MQDLADICSERAILLICWIILEKGFLEINSVCSAKQTYIYKLLSVRQTEKDKSRYGKLVRLSGEHKI